jgi:HEAT repeat protein
MAVAMDAVVLLHDAVVALLKDEDQYLRVEAVRALASCDSSRTRQVLREALLDSHPLVVEAAEQVLAQFAAAPAPAANENAETPDENQGRLTESMAGKLPLALGLEPMSPEALLAEL